MKTQRNTSIWNYSLGRALSSWLQLWRVWQCLRWGLQPPAAPYIRPEIWWRCKCWDVLQLAWESVQIPDRHPSSWTERDTDRERLALYLLHLILWPAALSSLWSKQKYCSVSSTNHCVGDCPNNIQTQRISKRQWHIPLNALQYLRIVGCHICYYCCCSE